MGDWVIKISGIGAHHNVTQHGNPYDPFKNDADRLAAQLVQLLKDRGQLVSTASFESTRGVELIDGDYLDQCRRLDDGQPPLPEHGPTPAIAAPVAAEAVTEVKPAAPEVPAAAEAPAHTDTVTEPASPEAP